MYMKKYYLIFLFFDSDACVEQESSWSEFAHTKELEQPKETELQPKF